MLNIRCMYISRAIKFRIAHLLYRVHRTVKSLQALTLTSIKFTIEGYPTLNFSIHLICTRSYFNTNRIFEQVQIWTVWTSLLSGAIGGP